MLPVELATGQSFAVFLQLLQQAAGWSVAPKSRLDDEPWRLMHSLKNEIWMLFACDNLESSD